MSLTCYVHPEASANDRCSECRRAICPMCVVEVDHRTICRSCSERRSARRGRIKLAALATLLTASAATLWFLFLRKTGDEPSAKAPPDAGIPQEFLDEMAALREKLKADPCDPAASWKLGGLQNALRDYQATLALADRTIQSCGEQIGIRQAQLYALEKMENWDQAVGITSALVAEDPTVGDYWAWRADAEDGKGELDQAAFDYRQSLAIYPNNAVVKFADLARRRDRPCEGVFALTRFIDVIANTRAWVHDMRRDLYVEGDCGMRLGRGTAPMPRGAVVRATVGGATGQFLLGRFNNAHLVVTRAFAERAGLTPKANPSISVLAAGELTTASIAEVAEVSIGPLTAAGFEAAVVDALAPVNGRPIDGVIGLDFLWRFDSVWERGREVLRPLSIAL